MKSIELDLVKGDKLRVIYTYTVDITKGFQVGDEIIFERYTIDGLVYDNNSFLWDLNQLKLVEEWEPQFGEKVLVRDENHQEWKERIFMSYVKQSHFPYLCAAEGHQDEFMRGEKVYTNNWKDIKRIEKPEEMTLEQVCEELGRTIKIVK